MDLAGHVLERARRAHTVARPHEHRRRGASQQHGDRQADEKFDE